MSFHLDRSKTQTLDPDDYDLVSYRPMSNLSFFPEVIERVVTSRFPSHIITTQSLPFKRSAYRLYIQLKPSVLYLSMTVSSELQTVDGEMSLLHFSLLVRLRYGRSYHSSSCNSVLAGLLYKLLRVQIDCSTAARHASVWTGSSRDHIPAALIQLHWFGNTFINRSIAYIVSASAIGRRTWLQRSG